MGSVFDFLFLSFSLVLLVVVVGGVVESRRRRMVFNTAGAGGEDSSFVSVCWKRRRIRFALWVHSLKGPRACVKNVQVHKGATELRNGKQKCLGMGTRYECGEMW